MTLQSGSPTSDLDARGVQPHSNAFVLSPDSDDVTDIETTALEPTNEPGENEMADGFAHDGDGLSRDANDGW